MTFLLDANVLIALVDPSHVHHDPASAWLQRDQAGFATCPITQGALVRYLLRQGHDQVRVGSALRRIQALPQHHFWPDDLPFSPKVIERTTGYRQVTDSYLCHLASAHSGTVATYDRGLVALHPAVSVLMPTS
ncbi:MAG: PIN domain-containing protein [Actinobacteria bacterium]|nr:PIN domain-containing protein [Actinomycetota bacterium]